jgi:pyridoxamine 5'-phosphate oxidase
MEAEQRPSSGPRREPRPDLAALREEYRLGGLAEDELDPDPFTMFDRWLHQAMAATLYEPNAMVVATVGADGAPSTRSVLLKQVTDRGCCSLLVPWYELQRQVRIEGVAERLDRTMDEAYFASRPRDSQLGAWASAQSRPVADRAELDAAYEAARARFDGQEVPCPPFWGGYQVVPHTFEFWQGRRGRMHDRLVYRRTDLGWEVARLAP